MSFTRISDDPINQLDRAESSCYTSRYVLNVPGAGYFLPFVEDPHIRLQKWGANMMTNTMNLNSELSGRSEYINKSDVNSQPQRIAKADTAKVLFPSMGAFVEQSRTVAPAWTFRELERNRWDYLPVNPQYSVGEFSKGSFGLEKPFIENVSTRILEKDMYVPRQSVGVFDSKDYLPR